MYSIIGLGTSKNQFNNPSDICYKNGQIFNAAFQFLNLLRLDFSPNKLHASNLVFCIRFTKATPGVYFYQFKSLLNKNCFK